MSNVKKWAHSRTKRQQLADVLPVNTVLNLIKSEYGDNAYQNLITIVDPHKNFLLRKYNYSIQDIVNNNIDLSICKSEFDKKMVSTAAREYQQNVKVFLNSLCFSDLSKAVQAKDWKRISNKHNPEATLSVDHKPHISQFPAPQEYQNMLNHSNKYPGVNFNEGISAKMVHDISGYHDKENQWVSTPQSEATFMSKPYHKKIESATKSWVTHPILGWATMATKALFNAGNIGHLAEDVSTHEHQNIPMTVHRFTPNMYMAAQVNWNPNVAKNINVNATDIHKIGVMDYLTNNLDRHGGNFMVSDSEYNDDGYNKVLAIDHERNFQYNKNLMNSFRGSKNTKESPLSYINASGMNTLHISASRSWGSHDDLVDWWNKHGDNIHTEFENQLKGITDDQLRSHVRDNFMMRWHKMDDWAKRLNQTNNTSDDMYDINSLGDNTFHVWNSKIAKQSISAKTLKSLPDNPKDALFALSDIINKKGSFTQRQRDLLSNAIDQTFNKMTPEQAGDALRHIIDNPYMNTKTINNNPDLSFRNRFLNFFRGPQGWDNNTPIFRNKHLSAIVDVISTLPPEKREVLDHWANHYKSLLQQNNERIIA